MSTQLLPDDLVWDETDASHLSEIALTAVADGEEALLPANARTHLESCESCGRKLGEAAMLSNTIGAALRGASTTSTATATATVPASVTPARDSARARARIPMGAIAAGLALAILGAVPMLLDLPSFLADARFFAVRGLPVVVRSGFSLARASEGASTALTLASALVLVVAALFLARRLPSLRIVTQGVP